MSFLVIILIAIALIGLTSLSTMYFGGDSMNRGAAKAAANTLINQASQIDGANTLYFLDNQADAADIDALVTAESLASVPNPGSIADAWTIADGVVSAGNVGIAVCEKVNEVSGVDNETKPSAADVASVDLGAQFGCAMIGAVGSEVPTFVHM